MKVTSLNCRIISIIMLLFSFQSIGQSNVLIEGFAEWQADRVERIALDQAVFGMMENEYVVAFFPNTTATVDSYGGGTSSQRLIPLIQLTIKKDINDVEKTFTTCIKTYINVIKLDVEKGDSASLIKAFDKLKKFNANLAGIKNTNGTGASIPTLYQDFRLWVCGEDTNNPTINSVDKDNVPSGVLSTIDINDSQIIKTVRNSQKEANDSLKAFSRSEGISNTPSAADIDKAIDLINSMLDLINEYEDYRAISDPSKTSIISIHFFVRFFELFGSNDQNYTKFKSLGLFLASLIEADKAEDVAAILDTFIDDQEAYRNKRVQDNTALFSMFTLPSYNATNNKVEESNYTGSCIIIGCQNTLFLGSYFGVSIVNLPDEETLKDELQVRAFGPVGIEYKLLNIYGRPITINLAPFDIGNYVSNELQDVEYTARFSDIVAPSVFLSFSMREHPFSIMAGYQKDVKVGNEIEENTFFISFAFDLPIFTIY